MCCPARPVPLARRGWPCRTFCKFGEEQDVASGNSSPSQSLPVSGANALVFATDCVQTCLILQKLEIASEQSCSTSEKNNATSNASSETFDLQLQENFWHRSEQEVPQQVSAEVRGCVQFQTSNLWCCWAQWCVPGILKACSALLHGWGAVR